MKKILTLGLFLIAGWASAGVVAVKGPNLAITGITDATPQVVTTAAHGLVANDWVEIRGSVVADGIWKCSAVSSTSCTLQGSVSRGIYSGTGGVMQALGVVAATTGPWYDFSKAGRGYAHVWSNGTSTSTVTIEATLQPGLNPPSPATVLVTLTDVPSTGVLYDLPVLSFARVHVSAVTGTVYAVFDGVNESGTVGIRVDPALSTTGLPLVTPLIPTRTNTPTVTLTPTLTITPTVTLTRTVTPTATVTLTGTVTKTPTPTVTKTNTPTPQHTRTPTFTKTPTLTPTPTRTPTSTPTNTPTRTPTITP
jgi:hypothetical protein